MVRKRGFFTSIQTRLEVEQSPGTRQQQVQISWISDEAQGANLRSQAKIFGLDPGSRLQDNGNEPGSGIFSYPPRQFIAVYFRHHDVGNDQIGLIRFNCRESLLALSCLELLVSCHTQRTLQQIPFIGVIVNHKDVKLSYHKCLVRWSNLVQFSL